MLVTGLAFASAWVMPAGESNNRLLLRNTTAYRRELPPRFLAGGAAKRYRPADSAHGTMPAARFVEATCRHAIATIPPSGFGTSRAATKNFRLAASARRRQPART